MLYLKFIFAEKFLRRKKCSYTMNLLGQPKRMVRDLR